MAHITLTPDQKDRLREDGSLEILDAEGNRVATLSWEDTTDFVQDLKRKIAESRGKPKVPGKRVLEHLASLEKEWERTGGFTKEFAVQFVTRLREEEAK